MSKYIKLEDAIHNINLEVTGRKEYTCDMKANLFFALDDLPTIEVSEDCISREYILGEAFMSGEYNGETKSFDLPVVSVRDIEDAPSVVPSCQKNRQVERVEGEWENYKDEHRCSECGEVVIGDWYDDEWYDYCPNCGSRMKGIDNGTVKSKSE